MPESKAPRDLSREAIKEALLGKCKTIVQASHALETSQHGLYLFLQGKNNSKKIAGTIERFMKWPKGAIRLADRKPYRKDPNRLRKRMARLAEKIGPTNAEVLIEELRKVAGEGK